MSGLPGPFGGLVTEPTQGGELWLPELASNMAYPMAYRFRRFFLTFRAGPLAMVAAALLALSFASAAPAMAQGAVKRIEGDWQVRCDQAPGAPSEQCALVQNVTAEDRENIGLSVIVLKTADGKGKILRVLAPLGVLLPSRLGLYIDQENYGSTDFVRCLANGCIAEVVMDNDLVQKLENGKTASFIIFQTPEEGIGIPISLNGFKAGFESLQ